MPKIEMTDMVVLLPGILGSVLQKDGEDIWNISVGAIWRGSSEIVSRCSLLEGKFLGINVRYKWQNQHLINKN